MYEEYDTYSLGDLRLERRLTAEPDDSPDLSYLGTATNHPKTDQFFIDRQIGYLIGRPIQHTLAQAKEHPRFSQYLYDGELENFILDEDRYPTEQELLEFDSLYLREVFDLDLTPMERGQKRYVTDLDVQFDLSYYWQSKEHVPLAASDLKGIKENWHLFESYGSTWEMSYVTLTLSLNETEIAFSSFGSVYRAYGWHDFTEVKNDLTAGALASIDLEACKQLATTYSQLVKTLESC